MFPSGLVTPEPSPPVPLRAPAAPQPAALPPAQRRTSKTKNDVSGNNKLLGTSASLLVTSALLVVTRSY